MRKPFACNQETVVFQNAAKSIEIESFHPAVPPSSSVPPLSMLFACSLSDFSTEILSIMRYSQIAQSARPELFHLLDSPFWRVV